MTPAGLRGRASIVFLLLWGWSVAFTVADVFAQTLSFEPVGRIPGPAGTHQSAGEVGLYRVQQDDHPLRHFESGVAGAPGRLFLS